MFVCVRAGGSLPLLPAAIKSTLSQVPDSCEISPRIIIPSEIKGLKFRGGTAPVVVPGGK